MIRSVEFDCVTLRERNQRFMSRGGVMAAASRQKAARKKTCEVLAATFGAAPGLWYTPAGAAPSYTEANPITVRMWRVGPGMLDSDGPDDALKACRDGVADWLGLDDRNVGVEWPRGMQEKTAPRTPWRVRIEVEDRTPGADRRVVLASEPVKAKGPRKAKKPKAAPAGDPGEELAARLLVACEVCGAASGKGCNMFFVPPGVGQFQAQIVFGVHAERAKAAGINGVSLAAPRPRPPRTGVRKLAVKLPRPAPPGQARLPLARCYVALPYEQPRCPACASRSFIGGDALTAGQHAALQARCPTCHGSGIGGPPLLAIEGRVDGLRPPASLAYTVPEAHRARWGKTITLYRQHMAAGRLGTITVYALKGR